MNALTLEYGLDAIVLGIVGALVALFIGISFQVLGNATDRIFKDRFVARVMVAGIIIAIIGYFLPELLFSGESQIHPSSTTWPHTASLCCWRSQFSRSFCLGSRLRADISAGRSSRLVCVHNGSTRHQSPFSWRTPRFALHVHCGGNYRARATRVPCGHLLTVTIATAKTYELGYISLATATALIIGAAFKQRIARRAEWPGGPAESRAT